MFLTVPGLFDDDENEDMETVNEENRMDIPAPKFLQWATVWKFQNNTVEPAKIVERLYNPDAGIWFYKLEGMSSYIREENLNINPNEFVVFPVE